MIELASGQKITEKEAAGKFADIVRNNDLKITTELVSSVLAGTNMEMKNLLLTVLEAEMKTEIKDPNALSDGTKGHIGQLRLIHSQVLDAVYGEPDESLLPTTDGLEERELVGSGRVSPDRPNNYRNLEISLRGWTGKCPERKFQIPSDDELLKLEFKNIDELENWLEDHGIPRSAINPTYILYGPRREEERYDVHVILRNNQRVKLVEDYRERIVHHEPLKFSERGISAIRELVSEIDECEAIHIKLVEEQSQLIAQYGEPKNVPKTPRIYPDVQSYCQQLASWGVPVQFLSKTIDGGIFINSPHYGRFILGSRITQRPIDQRVEMIDANILSLLEVLEDPNGFHYYIETPHLFDSWGFPPPPPGPNPDVLGTTK